MRNRINRYAVAIALAFGLLYTTPSALAQCPGGKCPSVIPQGGTTFSPFYKITTPAPIVQAAPGCPDKAWTSLATGQTLYEHSDGIWRDYRQGHAGETGPIDGVKFPPKK